MRASPGVSLLPLISWTLVSSLAAPSLNTFSSQAGPAFRGREAAAVRRFSWMSRRHSSLTSSSGQTDCQESSWRTRNIHQESHSRSSLKKLQHSRRESESTGRHTAHSTRHTPTHTAPLLPHYLPPRAFLPAVLCAQATDGL
jgi:hypothetical protein